MGYQHAVDTKMLIIKEKEQELTRIVTTLEQRLPKKFENILKEQHALNLTHEEKVIVLNKQLQPIINETSQEYPGFGMGYGMYSQRIAFHPFSKEALSNKIGQTPLGIYQTKTITTYFNENSNTWGNAEVMFVNYPLIYEGEMIGHAWANTKMDVLNSAIFLAWAKSLVFLIFVWIIMMLLVRKAFNQIGKGLNELTHQIINQDDDSTHLVSFPELKPLLETVIKLREDITIRERAESILKSKQAQLVDTCPVPIIEIDKDGRLLALNNAAFNLYKNNTLFTREELVGRSIIEFSEASGIDIDDYEVMKVLQSGEDVINKHIKVLDKEFLFTGIVLRNPNFNEITGAIAIYLDITDYEKLRAEMAKLDRLSVVGEVASSVAHELRNPATTIKGFIQLLHRKCSPDQQNHFEIILEELDRMNLIIEDFLSLARNRKADKITTNLNQLLIDLQPLLAADTLKNDIELRYNLSNEIELTILNPKEIRQVILNLSRNAIEAMHYKGVLTISTQNEAHYVKLTITDTGSGIPNEALENIFDPFFTLKAEGTGLGLSVCKNIIDSHNGRIEVSSKLKEGTSFSIYLPSTLLSD